MTLKSYWFNAFLLAIYFEVSTCQKSESAAIVSQPYKSFEASIAEWVKKSCTYPDPFFYKETSIEDSGLVLKPCKDMLPLDSSDTSQSVQKVQLSRELCQTIVKFTDAMCKDDFKEQGQKFFSKDLIIDAADYSIGEVCAYVGALPKDVYTWVPDFMFDMQTCKQVCDDDFATVCQMFVSTLCRYVPKPVAGKCILPPKKSEEEGTSSATSSPKKNAEQVTVISQSIDSKSLNNTLAKNSNPQTTIKPIRSTTTEGFNSSSSTTKIPLTGGNDTSLDNENVQGVGQNSISRTTVTSKPIEASSISTNVSTILSSNQNTSELQTTEVKSEEPTSNSSSLRPNLPMVTGIKHADEQTANNTDDDRETTVQINDARGTSILGVSLTTTKAPKAVSTSTGGSQPQANNSEGSKSELPGSSGTENSQTKLPGSSKTNISNTALPGSSETAGTQPTSANQPALPGSSGTAGTQPGSANQPTLPGSSGTAGTQPGSANQPALPGSSGTQPALPGSAKQTALPGSFRTAGTQPALSGSANQPALPGSSGTQPALPGSAKQPALPSSSKTAGTQPALPGSANQQALPSSSGTADTQPVLPGSSQTAGKQTALPDSSESAVTHPEMPGSANLPALPGSQTESSRSEVPDSSQTAGTQPLVPGSINQTAVSGSSQKSGSQPVLSGSSQTVGTQPEVSGSAKSEGSQPAVPNSSKTTGSRPTIPKSSETAGSQAKEMPKSGSQQEVAESSVTDSYQPGHLPASTQKPYTSTSDEDDYDFGDGRGYDRDDLEDNENDESKTINQNQNTEHNNHYNQGTNNEDSVKQVKNDPSKGTYNQRQPDNELSSELTPGSGHFFGYFLTAIVICISGYIIFHNKQKIVAFIVEGKSANGRRRGGNGGPKYTQLKSNVEEVLPSLETATTHKNFVY